MLISYILTTEANVETLHYHGHEIGLHVKTAMSALTTGSGLRQSLAGAIPPCSK